MKKAWKTLIGALSVCCVMTGCGAASYVFSGGMNETKIEVSADDGSYGESFTMDVSDKNTLEFTPDLSEGELQIEIVEVINTADIDESDDYEVVDTITSVNVKGDEVKEVKMDRNAEIMLQVTAVGKTEGTVIVKKK